MRRRSASYVSTSRARDRVTSLSAVPSELSSHRATAPWAAASTPTVYQSTGSSSTPTIAYGTACPGVSAVLQSTLTCSPGLTTNGLATSSSTSVTSRMNSQYTAGTTVPRRNRYAASRQAAPVV